MKEILILATGVVFLSIIFSYIVPDGKLKNSINLILRLVCMLVLLTPITSFLFPNQEDVIFIDYDKISAVYKDSQEDYLEFLIYDKFDLICDCNISINYNNKEVVETGVEVNLMQNFNNLDKLYSYLEDLGYINIIVNEQVEISFK